ncbi:hypothetical protein CYY_002322 [Polysphondylium violaceum]|uniref:Saposin B-type domain-containing protein n=1 Tax=Polysphondylium violaceum TaxID=133409 RepID=A0A8J4V0W6_9MYCE|nr:hypothetical protein CYY_002322 [Polysphondylium violaceum]
MKYLAVLLFAVLALSTSVQAQMQCEVCEFVAAKVEAIAANNQSIAYVETHLEGICNYLPGTYGQACTFMVKSYTQVVLNMIINNETPEVICSQLGFCPATEEVTLQQLEETAPVTSLGKHHHHHHHNIVKKLECKVCDWLVKKVEQHIFSGHSQQEIIRALDSECHHFDIKAAINLCKKEVAQEVPKMIEHLKRKETPAAVCKMIAKC